MVHDGGSGCSKEIDIAVNDAATRARQRTALFRRTISKAFLMCQSYATLWLTVRRYVGNATSKLTIGACVAENKRWGDLTIMPKGTRVEKIYSAIVRETGDKGKAARIAQAQTHQSLATGKPLPSKPKGGKTK